MVRDKPDGEGGPKGSGSIHGCLDGSSLVFMTNL